MNSGAAGTLAVGRVKFFGQHRGEVTRGAWRQSALARTRNDWHRVAGTSRWCSGRCSMQDPLEFDCSCTPSHTTPPASRHLFLRVTRPGLPSSPIKAQSGQMLRHLGGHQDSVQSSDFAPSSDSLATGSWDSAICIWDLRMETTVTHQKLEGHSGNISCLCYSASGLLASGSWDKTIHIWKPSTKSLLVQLKGHVSWLKSIAFSPDGSQLASAGYSHMVKVWDCNTGKCIETLKGVLDVAHACAFTPDGKLLVSGAADQARYQVRCRSNHPEPPHITSP
ncbi:WD repeat-containing protein 38 isoform X2 [Crocuta crocuta]